MKHIKDLIKRALNVNLRLGIVLLIDVAVFVGLLGLIIWDLRRHDIAHVITDGLLLGNCIRAIKDVIS